MHHTCNKDRPSRIENCPPRTPWPWLSSFGLQQPLLGRLILASAVAVSETDLPDGIHGYTAFEGRRVFVDRLLLADERRATLTHEAVHIELGPSLIAETERADRQRGSAV